MCLTQWADFHTSSLIYILILKYELFDLSPNFAAGWMNLGVTKASLQQFKVLMIYFDIIFSQFRVVIIYLNLFCSYFCDFSLVTES